MKNKLTTEFDEILTRLTETLKMKTAFSTHYQWLGESPSIFRRFTSNELRSDNDHLQRELSELSDYLEMYSDATLVGNAETTKQFDNLFIGLSKLMKKEDGIYHAVPPME